MLSTLYIFSFVDRLVLGLLVDPIKATLAISDLQIGLLMGPAFAIFYGVLGLPIAALADAGDRRRLILAGVMLWGICTFASAFAAAFWVLVVLRIGLAVGEAVLTPATYSLIADWFTPAKRTFPATIYAWSGQLGGMLGIAATALLVRAVVEQGVFQDIPFFSSFASWQTVFFILGAVTMLLVLATMVVLKEPVRIRSALHDDKVGGLQESLRYMLKNRRIYACIILGGSLNTIVTAALAAWAPQLLRRNYGWEVSQAGVAFGIAIACASVLGYLVLPWIVETIRRRSGNNRVIINAALLSSLVGNLLMAAAVLAPSAPAFLVLMALGYAISVYSILLPITSIPIIAPPRMRAVASAANQLVSVAVALSLGPVLAPLFGSLFFADQGEQALSLGVLVCALLVPVITVPMLIWSRRPFTDALRAELEQSA